MPQHSRSLLGAALTWGVGRQARGPGNPENGTHRPSACHDSGCLRPPCRWYREGREDGYDDGYDDGYAAAKAASR